MKIFFYLGTVLFFLAIAIYPQSPIIMIPNVSAPPSGQKLTVPINVSHFNNIGAVSLKIRYNPAVVRFDSSSRRAEFVSGVSGEQIGIGRADVNPVTPTDGKLLDLYFTYSGGSVDLTFNNSDCELATTTGDIVSNVIYIGGSITPSVPVFTSTLPDTALAEGDTLIFDYNASDPTNDVLTYSLQSGNPTGAIINPTSGLLTWITGNNQAGVHSIIVGVSDGTNLVLDTAAVTVTKLNLPPVFVSTIPDTTVFEGDTLNFTVIANDPDGNESLRFGVVSPPQGFTINSVSGALVWAIGFDQSGEYNIIYSVTDGTVTITDTAHITVTEVNRAPYFIDVMPDQLNKGVGDTITFQYTAGDSDGVANLRYGLLNPPSGASIDSISGEFRFITPSPGSFKIIVSATDHVTTVYDTANVDIITGIKTELGIPGTYELSQNYPNPFNPATTIRFSLPKESHVTLRIYNIVGEQVALLVNEVLTAAYHEYSFNAPSLTSGIYIYRLQAGEFTSTKKMTLIK